MKITEKDIKQAIQAAREKAKNKILREENRRNTENIAKSRRPLIIKEVADRLGVCEKTIRRWVKRKGNPLRAWQESGPHGRYMIPLREVEKRLGEKIKE